MSRACVNRLHRIDASLSRSLERRRHVRPGRWLRDLRQRRLGEEQHARHRDGVLERDADDLRGIDDPRLDEVDVRALRRVEAVVAVARCASARRRRRRRRPSSRRSAATGASSACLRMRTPLRSSPSHFVSSRSSASAARSSVRPAPGTIPSATAAFVALMASSKASFRDFSSASDGAPTRTTATPPASFARRSSSFSRS